MNIMRSPREKLENQTEKKITDNCFLSAYTHAERIFRQGEEGKQKVMMTPKPP